MASAKHFQNCLDKGLNFERNIATPLLHKLYPEFWVNNFAKDPTHKFGPRMFRGKNMEQELVLPDFHLFQPNTFTSIWVDAKLKNQPYSSQVCSRPGKQFLTLDKKSHRDYLEFTKQIPGILYLLFGIESSRNMYLTEWNPEPETVEYNNKYGNGATPIYFISDMKPVGNF